MTPPGRAILVVRWAARIVFWTALVVLVARNLRGNPDDSRLLVAFTAAAGVFLGTSHLLDNHDHHDNESETR